MDYTPPASPLCRIDVTQRNNERLPISPITPDLKKFPLLRNNVFNTTDITPETSLYYLEQDLNTYKISPMSPSLNDSSETLQLLSDWTHQDIEQKIISGSMDFIKDPTCKLKSSRILGQGSYCYICEVETDSQNPLVLKFPHSKRKTRTLLNEALILTYLHMTDSGLEENYIIPFNGITYINKLHFNKLRRNEYIPALILPKLNLNLQQLIKFLKQNYSHDISMKKTIWKKLFNGMIIALHYLKLKKVIHGDIKTANIMVSALNKEGIFSLDDLTFYLCDFTSSIIDISADIKYAYRATETVTQNNLSLDTTLEYCPPEVIERMTNSNNSTNTEPIFSHMTDLYSLGLCLLSFICENEPYRELKNFKFHNDMTDSSSSPYGGSSGITSSVQHTQWLINSILRNDPITLNTFNGDENYYRDNWSEELSLVSKILVNRISLEGCISYI